MFERIKKWYKQGLWTEEMVWNAVEKGIITEKEYNKIMEENLIKE